MYQTFNTKNIRASLVDRLLDHEANIQSEYSPLRTQSKKQYIKSIIRDLSVLFNTRSSTFERSYEANSLSVIDYGIPDLAHYSIENFDDRLKLTNHLTHAILHFEPRIRDPEIEPDMEMLSEKCLQIKLKGTIVISTVPLQVTFLAKQNFESNEWAIYETIR